MYTASNIEWRSSHCASTTASTLYTSGGKKSSTGGGHSTSTSTSAASTSSSTDSHLHQPLPSENTSYYLATCSGYYSATNHLTIELEEPLPLSGDIKMEVSAKPGKLSKKNKLFHCWFNTFFADGIHQQQFQRGSTGSTGEPHRERNGSGCNSSSANTTYNDDSSCTNNGSCTNSECKGHLTDPSASFSSSCSNPSGGGSGNIIKRDSMTMASSDNSSCCAIKVRYV